MILVLDNYDSFVHNLARYLQLLGQQTQVVRSDAITVAEIARRQPAAIVISPGPCTPKEAGCSVETVRELGGAIPILGVCLGHQAIAAALGSAVVRAPQPWHGRASLVQHDGSELFHGVPNPVTVGRYHSLIVDETSLPETARVTARTADGLVMAIQHRTQPLVGVQFHPESILTEYGFQMLANFLQLAGCPLTAEIRSLTHELIRTTTPSWPFPEQPLTF